MSRLRPLITLLAASMLTVSVHGAELLATGFEGTTNLPAGWTEQKLVGNRSWSVQSGSGDASLWTGSVYYPEFPKSGAYNACLYYHVKGTKTRLVSPVFDSTGYLNLSLSFWHTQVPFGGAGGQDTLKILYSSDGGTTWTERAYYDYHIGSWTQRTIFLGAPSANSRIAFEAIANYGAGVCLDDISVTADSAGSLPEVSVSATDAAASETGPDGGTWTISRTGNTSSAMTVNFSLGGTATQGDDYSVSNSTSVTIPKNQSSVQVTLSPVDDFVYDELDETAVLTLTPNAAYGLGAAYEDTITIADNDVAAVKVLIIGSSRDSDDSSQISNGGSSPFDGAAVRDQLDNILAGAGVGGANVTYLDRSAEGYSTDVFSLAQWFHYPYPEDVETTVRWPNLRGEGDHDWDYVVLIGDPYSMEKMPGLYAQGVAAIGQEVAKGAGETVLLMPWPAAGSPSSVAHYKEVVYRAGRTGGYKVAPAALAWEADGSPTDATRCAYISAASIYSRIWGQSAANSSYTYNDALANSVNTVVTNSVGTAQYSGKFNFSNPFLMLGDPRREVLYGEKGTSTEADYVSGSAAAMNRCRVNYSTSGFRDSYSNNMPGWTGDHLPIAWNHGRKFAEANKEYVTNTDYWQLGMGFTYQANTWSLPVATANDQQIGNMFSSEIDLAGYMIEANNPANGQDASARCIPWRHMWALIHQEYPSLNPLRDGSGPHVNTDLREAVGTYMYTLYSGRCPLDPMPNPMTTKWFAQKVGYETAWRMGNCASRAPGFKVMPSAANKLAVTPTTTETMTVQFIFAPQSDVTVQVSSSDTSAAIVGPQTLVFTPSNYNVPQTVTVTGVAGATASADFSVNYSTTSDDPAYDGLSDSWAYTTTRSIAGVTHVDNGTTQYTTPKNFGVTTNLGASGAGAGNTNFAGPNHGTLSWSGSDVIYTPDADYVGSDGFAYSCENGGTVTTGYIHIDVIDGYPDGSVRAEATDSTATEEGQTTGTWTIIREGSTASNLAVNFALGGAATLGSDYNLNETSPVTIPSGQSSVTITLTAIDDSVFGEHTEAATLTIASGTGYTPITSPATIGIADNDNNAPTVEAGANQSVYLDSGSSTPGLWYGTVSGDIDTTTPNPKTLLITNVAAYTEDGIAGNTTEIYTGRIFDADGSISFTENNDDKARIWIDGVLVINNDSWGNRTSTADLNLTPGWHDIEIRISNGGGGSGPASGIGIGYDPNGGTTWQTLVDPGDGSFLSVGTPPSASVTLNGSVADPEDTPATLWTVASTTPSGLTAIFDNATATNATATFTEAGTYVLRLTANDGYGEVYDEVTIVVNPALPGAYATWAGGTFANPFTDIDPNTNGDGDRMGNMMEFAFGTDPTVSDGGSLAVNGSANGQPKPVPGAGDAVDFYFVRRDDHGTSGSVSYTVQFSTDLGSFTTSAVTPTFVADSSEDSAYEVVKVPFPVGSRFARIQVNFVE